MVNYSKINNNKWQGAEDFSAQHVSQNLTKQPIIRTYFGRASYSDWEHFSGHS